MSTKIFGIDFGTNSLKIYRKGEGLVYDQKSVIAIKGKNNVIAIGNEAFEMYGKSPEYITVDFPLKHGAIASLSHMLSLLNCVFLDLSRQYGKFRGAEFTIATPYDITEVEKRAFYDLVDSSIVRPKKLRLVEKPIADAIGAGIDVSNSQGALLVNIGADTTEISILSMGGIVLSKLLPIGGNQFDDAIAAAVRKKYNLVIGQKTAEYVKRTLTDFSQESELTCKAYGRDIVTGLPREREISAALVNQAVLEDLNTIIETIRTILERTPPEIASDVFANGMTITGGSSAIAGLDQLVQATTGLRVSICPKGALTVIEGLSHILEEPEFDALAQPLKESYYNEK